MQDTTVFSFCILSLFKTEQMCYFIFLLLASQLIWYMSKKLFLFIKPGFHYTANPTTTTQKQSDYKVEQSSFTLIALFWLGIGRCRGRN